MFEDDDYARRLAAKGLRLAVARDAFVHHWGRGSFRALPEAEYLRLHAENRARFEKKWNAPPSGAVAPASGEQVLEEARRSGSLFVFPPSIGWDITLVQRPHHLARAIARQGFPVIFEEGNGAGPVAIGLRAIEPRLYVARPAAAQLAGAPSIYWAFASNVPEDRRLAGARLVYDVIDHPDVFPPPRRFLRKNHERALERAEVVLAVSRPLWDDVRRS